MDPELGVLVWSLKEETKDKDKTREQVTMAEFCALACSMFQCLRFTWDSPGKNGEGWMAVLDTMVRMDFSQRLQGIPEGLGGSRKEYLGATKKIIVYKFYRKKVARQTPMLARSALPESCKVATAAQEFIRKFKNTNRLLPTK